MGYTFHRLLLGCFLFTGLNTALAQPVEAPITVTLSADASAPELAPRFLGFSYEMKVVLPKDGKYYFDASDKNLVRMFRTLGIKNLRVGANAVDDPKIGVPDTKDIDALFAFARKAGVKVIYSFRLKNGDPANAARLAAYITKNYSDALDCFSVGNEPNFYLKTYEAFRDAWTPEYEAILKAAPSAMFDEPTTAGKDYSLPFARDFFSGGHIAMISVHSYPLGNGRDAEKHPAVARAQFVSNRTERHYQSVYDNTCAPLAEKNIPFRMDETNSCYHGGAKDCSDSYASTLWGLDYMNWWAAHHILGLNFHTGDTVNGFPDMLANYAAFVHETNGKDFEIRPISYAMLAFTQIAHGKAMDVKIDAPTNLNFNAFAYEDGSNIYVAAMNKSYGDAGTTATVTLQLPAKSDKGEWQRMNLEQSDSDIAAKNGISLGGSDISPRGKWNGKWTNLNEPDANLVLTIKPASVVLLKFSSGSSHD